VVNDTISDMLTRIQKCQYGKTSNCSNSSTKMSLAIAKILKEEGFIEDFESYSENNRKYLLISLKYIGKSRKPVICKIQRISKPGLRVYSNAQNNYQKF
jgi:small subunit ribosomal protein S8